ncbi:conserved hypothetical protein [Verticillium alfalfae VaMs.102]|uniref:Exosome complex protein n=1 Tax=Verticillium alfalfae (strain VaMs.102 / ATCC MYA-4576 / FGSC 10136) TaxID=526221 RepID=C9SC23_VERA1|nr:conserved hypothetical protein [Verticillium alfalfae VaMs.102]EEY15907.1 conserved hypothetical protein [Verticillium alfalfae VaMs.102]
MDVKTIIPDLERLDGTIDELEESLEPLLKGLPEMSSELPLLDKAKLMTLTAYSIESLLFSALRLQGVDAANHEVMTELKRVKQYFAKIQKAEEPPAQRTTSVNTEAATRILKADLGSNSKDLKQKLEEKLAEERAKALLNSIQNSKRPAQDHTSASQGKKQRGGASASNGGSQQKNKKRKA